MSTNPLILAAVGVGAAYFLTRSGAGSAGGPPPPSTQGVTGRATVGIDAKQWRPGMKSQVFLPARWGYVQPPMAGVASPTPTAWRDRMIGMPAFFASDHAGDYRVRGGRAKFIGRSEANTPLDFQRTRRNRRLYVVDASSGIFGMPSRSGMREYYSRRVGASVWDAQLAPRFKFDVIPVNEQVGMYDAVTAQGQPFLVPDTELSSNQFNARVMNGQMAAAYQSRYAGTFVEREGFYSGGVAWTRTDGRLGSRNWGAISDENPDILYFVSETGLVALNVRTMRRVSDPSQLRPVWKGRPYGSVPAAPSPWAVNPIAPAGRTGISGGSFGPGGRSWWWSETLDLSAPGPLAAAFGPKDPAGVSQTWGDVAGTGFKRRLYPPDSAFVGRGVGLRKWATATGNTSFGCRGDRCYLPSLVSGVLLPGGRGQKSSIFGGARRAPFDFHAPAVLDAFLNSKLAFFDNSVRFSGDE